METKKCRRCGETKTIDLFGKNRNWCKKCRIECENIYHKTKSGVIYLMYAGQKRRSKMKGIHKPKYNLHQLKDWCFSQQKFHDLYDLWVDSGYDKWVKPSIDRIEDNLGYTFDNIQIVTWRENNIRSFIYLNHGRGCLPKR